MLIQNGKNSTCFSFANFRPVSNYVSSVGILYGKPYPVLNLIGKDLNDAVKTAFENYRDIQSGIESSDYVGITIKIWNDVVSVSGQFGTAYSAEPSADDFPVQEYRISFKIPTSLNEVGGTVIRGSGWVLNWERGSGISAEESTKGYLSVGTNELGYPADAQYAVQVAYSGIEMELDKAEETIETGIARVEAIVEEAVSTVNNRFVSR